MCSYTDQTFPSKSVSGSQPSLLRQYLHNSVSKDINSLGAVLIILQCNDGLTEAVRLKMPLYDQTV